MSAASGRKRSVISQGNRPDRVSHDRGPHCDICSAPTRNKREVGGYRVCTPCDEDHVEAFERYRRAYL